MAMLLLIVKMMALNNLSRCCEV